MAADSETVLIAGIPRGGTTLTCELLNRLGDVRALDEPMRIGRDIRAATDKAGRVDAARIVECLHAFAREQRASLLARGVAVTRHVDGRVDGSKMADERDEHGLRRKLADRGEVELGVPDRVGFTLAIKHPVAFTALLPVLRGAFRVYAIVRNPLAVLGSWETVPLPPREGRLGLPSALAPELNARLAAIDDRMARQLELLAWFFDRIAAELPAERVVRYEDIVKSGGASLAGLAPSAATLRVPLGDRNSTPVYDRAHLARIAPRLLERDGAFWRFYRRDDVERLVPA